MSIKRWGTPNPAIYDRKLLRLILNISSFFSRKIGSLVKFLFSYSAQNKEHTKKILSVVCQKYKAPSTRSQFLTVKPLDWTSNHVLHNPNV